MYACTMPSSRVDPEWQRYRKRRPVAVVAYRARTRVGDHPATWGEAGLRTAASGAAGR